MWERRSLRDYGRSQDDGGTDFDLITEGGKYQLYLHYWYAGEKAVNAKATRDQKK